MKSSVFPQTLAHLECQVQTRKIWVRIFKELDYSHTLAVVIEAAMIAHAFGQHLFARMPKRRVPQIVRESDCFREIFIQAQRTSNRATDRGDLNGVRQTGAQVIAGSVQKDLCLIFHSPKRAGVNDARAVTLEFSAIRMAGL